MYAPPKWHIYRAFWLFSSMRAARDDYLRQLRIFLLLGPDELLHTDAKRFSSIAMPHRKCMPSFGQISRRKGLLMEITIYYLDGCFGLIFIYYEVVAATTAAPANFPGFSRRGCFWQAYAAHCFYVPTPTPSSKKICPTGIMACNIYGSHFMLMRRHDIER